MATAEPFCRAVKPVCIVKEDQLTPGTARQLLRNELGREEVCGKPPVCPKDDKQAKTS